jgi:hypothetical protein
MANQVAEIIQHKRKLQEIIKKCVFLRFRTPNPVLTGHKSKLSLPAPILLGQVFAHTGKMSKLQHQILGSILMQTVNIHCFSNFQA